ncbi:MAG: 6-bladed beta-propeller [Clostridia bacterium]|nr:6-bladed beta-propeller [Clostridia bacterium]
MEEAKYTIDLDDINETSIPVSSIFKNVRTIVLETNEECLIGRIHEAQVFENYIYILDAFISKRLFVFDTEGKFVKKIGGLGRGPGEYIRVRDFTLDTENRFIFLQDQGTRIHKYYLDGTFSKSFTIEIPRYNNNYIQYHNDRLYVSVISWEPTKDDYMLVEADPDNGKIISQSLPIELNKEWAKPHFTGHSFFISRISSPKFTNLFMNYIMSLDNAIMPYIELKSKNLVTSQDLKEFPDGQSLQEMIPSSFQKIWDIHSYVENNDFIIFNFRIGLYVYKKLVYNKRTEGVKIVDYLSNDLMYRKNEENQLGRIVFSNSKGAYEVLPSSMIEKLQESIRRNEVVPDLDKKDELLKLNKESNPIIFFYEFK